METIMSSGAVWVRLKEIRTEKNLTQEAVSDSTGLSRATIINLEKDPRQLDLLTLEKLCRGLKMTPTEVLGYDPVRLGLEP